MRHFRGISRSYVIAILITMTFGLLEKMKRLKQIANPLWEYVHAPFYYSLLGEAYF